MKLPPLRSKSNSELATVVRLVTIAFVIAALFFGKEVLIPLALAFLLSFLLTPPVAWLEKLKLGRIASVVLVLTIAFSLGGGLIWLGTTQFAEIVSQLPQYQENIRRKIEAMRNPAGTGMTKVLDSVDQMTAEVTGTRNSPAEVSPAEKPRRKGARAPQSAPVVVLKRESGAEASLGLLGASLAHFLAMAAAVAIFTLFMLLQRGDLRNRLFRLFGAGHLNLMTTALDDAARRVSRYLLTQCLINGTFGLLLGLGLHWIGVPNAPFWGVLGAVLRFIPYVGTFIAGLCPLVLALAVFEGWARPMLTLGVFAGIEMTMSAAIEPWLYGAHTGISSLAILVSAAFWTLLWGPVGLVLSTPLTVCLLVLGRYVPPLKFLYVLLGDQEALPPEACYYQRLLALDEEEAQEVAETYLQEKTLEELYDLVLIPALSLAEQDRHRNALDDEREKFIYQTTKDLLERLAEQMPTEAPAFSDSAFTICCVPARDEADELVGVMLAELLRRSGYQARWLPLGTVEDTLAAIKQSQPDVLFISALPPFAASQARSLCRRIRREHPHSKIVIGFWDVSADVPKLQQRFGQDCSDYIVTSLRQAELQAKLVSAQEALLTANEPRP